MVHRILSKKLLQAAKQFPIVALMGPRQSGKTTLVKQVFSEMKYISLEDLEILAFAKEDPKGFLKTYRDGVILDEVQRAPELFSYIQLVVDETNRPEQFILTGSQNFLLHEKISQSLAGRVYLTKLLPFSLDELKNTEHFYEDFETFVYHGFYPRIYDRQLDPRDWYPSYIQTYIERDVRQVKNITDLSTFQRFLKMCAGRIGQLLNLSALAIDCGITHNTARAWLSVLESSFIIFLLTPHHRNFNKRLVKMPKLYFYDTGLACSLLGIDRLNQIPMHHLRGSLFEAMILAELFKHRYNHGLLPNCFFWRDKAGHEIDCLIEAGEHLIPVEIKSGKTLTKEFFKEFFYWQRLTGTKPEQCFLVYGGEQRQVRSSANVIPWPEVSDIVKKSNAG